MPLFLSFGAISTKSYHPSESGEQYESIVESIALFYCVFFDCCKNVLPLSTNRNNTIIFCSIIFVIEDFFRIKAIYRRRINKLRLLLYHLCPWALSLFRYSLREHSLTEAALFFEVECQAI